MFLPNPPIVYQEQQLPNSYPCRKIRDNLLGITRPAIRRLARRGGVMRIKSDIYDEIRVAVRDRLKEILRQVVYIMDSASTNKVDRKVITTRDIIFALNRMGNTIYGFD
ncbi:histone H4.2 [Aspergillus ambiguus]|uniref:histone H4 n=1 Tax=Aspergillus ambiguus TaxID=176160 RepID=UPI003CCD3AF9